MYINERIKKTIDKSVLPSPLNCIYKDLIKCFENGDDFKYEIYRDELETSAKQAYLSNQISLKTLKDLFHMVGIY